jgi:aspartate beta-hydroxylase
MSAVYQTTKKILLAIYWRRLSGPSVLSEKDFFPAADEFQAHWQEIRNEALSVAKNIRNIPRFHEIMEAQASISTYDDKDWRMYLVRAYGVDMPEAFEKCPALARLLKAHPEVTSATFSLMAPRKHVPTHTGPFRGVTRFFMGLSVPVDSGSNPAASLTLDDHEYWIGNGEHLLWDDTYPHSVDNYSDELRIVLLLDVYRKHMPWDMRVLSRTILSLVGLSIRVRDLFAPVKTGPDHQLQ